MFAMNLLILCFQLVVLFLFGDRIRETMIVLATSAYMRVFMRNDVEVVAPGIGMVHFKHHGRPCKLFIPLHRGPPRFRAVAECVGSTAAKDIFDEMKMYLGPSQDFVTNVKVTPKLLGYEGVTFVDRNERVYDYAAYDEIDFKSQ
jgi:hypothetical protein